MEKLLTPQELADGVGVPLATVYQWRYKGVGPAAIKVGRHVRYRADAVNRWLDSQTCGGGA